MNGFILIFLEAVLLISSDLQVESEEVQDCAAMF